MTVIEKLRAELADYDEAIERFGMKGTAHGVHGRKLAELVRELLTETGGN